MSGAGHDAEDGPPARGDSHPERRGDRQRRGQDAVRETPGEQGERERRTEMRREQRGSRLCDTDREKEIDR